MQEVSSIEDVEYEIKKAIKVLRALPKDGPYKAKSSWPKFLPEKQDEEYQKICVNFTPLPSEIDDMDVVFEQWFKVLDRQDRLLVFYKNFGYRDKVLMRIFNKARSSLFVQYKKALQSILDYVLEQQVKHCA